MNIVRVEVKVSPDSFEQLIARDREVEVRKTAEQALSIAGFHGHLCWPSAERGALCLIAEGGEEPDQLAETLQSLVGGSVSARIVAEVPDRATELSPDGRSRVIIKMGLEDEGERCGKCGAVPPHVAKCPFVFGDDGLALAQDTTLYNTGPSLSPDEEQVEEPVAAH